MQTSALTIPTLLEGERYAGIVIDSATGQPTHHLILIPQQPETRLTWDEAIAWAASIGVELPTRQESALLFANLKLAFESKWYWTSDQCAGNASHAWLQYFATGDQDFYDKVVLFIVLTLAILGSLVVEMRGLAAARVPHVEPGGGTRTDD